MDVLKYLHSIQVILTLDNILILILFIILIYFLIENIFKMCKNHLNKKIKIVNMNINIAGIGNVSIEINKDISKIAYKAWIEIMTRKVGLPFEEDKDVIVEVYDSWYALFSIIRELLKDIEPNHKDKNMEKLEDILIKTLNYGLRPHLTNWQAKFRRWYNYEINEPKNQKLSPQEIQKKYSEYDKLISDLKNTNTHIVQFAKELKKLI